MKLTQIPGYHMEKMQRFIQDMSSYANKGNDSKAFDLYCRYKNSEFIRLAEKYGKKLNGDCPEFKQKITFAVNEFNQIGILVETRISPPAPKAEHHNRELSIIDFLGYTAGGRHIDVLAEMAVA